jgi:hypothetical protein
MKRLFTTTALLLSLLSGGIARAEDKNFCYGEMLEQGTSNALAIGLLGTKLLKAVDKEMTDLFANPDSEQVIALASALTKSVEIVTKRPASSLVSNEAARWASDLQSETKTTKKKLDPVWDLLDDDERPQVLRDVNSKREPELKRAANWLVNTALSSCNHD